MLLVAAAVLQSPPSTGYQKGQKWSTEEMQKIPVRKVMPWPEDASQKALGSNPSAGKNFSNEISIKVYLHHLYMKFVYYASVSWASCSCVYVSDVPWIKIKGF